MNPLGTKRVSRSARWKVSYQRKIDRWPIEVPCRNEAHAYERAQEIVDNCGVSAQIYRRPTKAQAAQAPDTYGFILMDILYPGVPR